MIQEISGAVSIPVMAKCQNWTLLWCTALAIEIDYIE